MKIRSCIKKGIAVSMMAVMAFLLPATPLHETQVQAASKAGEYIKEVKLFIKKDGTIEDAKAWCESQGDGWQVIDGDLNAESATKETSQMDVFMCYQTTSDPDEAITDLAVMNEKGSYSVGEYERMLSEQKAAYADMIKNMNGMLTEYRANYEKKTQTAENAHDLLNAFKDDDSGQLLGDLLLTVGDDKLADILLQCNGTVLLTIHQQLAAACDTAKTTWLDRMMRLGSYDKLKDAFSKNIKGGSVTESMNRQYKEKAYKILDHWDDLHAYYDNAKNFGKKYGLDSLTKEQKDEWLDKLTPQDPAYADYQALLTLDALSVYAYGDLPESTLFSFFGKTKAEIEHEGIEILYPMAASLTDGQMSALNESVGIYGLIQDAMAATLINKGDAGLAGKIKNIDKKAVVEDKDEAVKKVEDMISHVTGREPVSIYEGVDREVFKGGVAVTKDAETLSNGSENSWINVLHDDKKREKLFSITALSTIGSALLSGVFSLTTSALKIKGINDEIYSIYAVIDRAKDRYAANGTMAFITDKNVGDAAKLIEMAESGDAQAKAALNNINSYVTKNTSYKFFNALKLGFAVFTVLLAVADIAIGIYTIYKHYHTEHIDIPRYMVSMTFGEYSEAAFVAYRSVRDQDDKCGDLNGGDCRQWLAFYYTKDKKAGEPILAPGSNNEWVYQTGKSDTPGKGYTPLHIFGTTNVAQNLTFYDGESGYSYRDGNKGTYLFFSHAGTVITYEGKDEKSGSTDDADDKTTADESDSQTVEVADAQAVSGTAVAADQTGTALSGGVLVLVGAAGIVAGGFGGFVIASRRRRKLPRE